MAWHFLGILVFDRQLSRVTNRLTAASALCPGVIATVSILDCSILLCAKIKRISFFFVIAVFASKQLFKLNA